MELRGKVAVITGASSGIGRALALELGRRGCELALVARRILEGIERELPLIRFPWQTSLLVRLAQMLPPRWYDALIARWSAR